MRLPDAPVTEEPHKPGLRPPRYTMRGLWALVTVLCVVFAVWASWGALAALGLLFLLLTIGAHVAGNAIGTRLRGADAAPGETPRRPRVEIRAAPTTQLSEHRSFPVVLGGLTIAGMVLGGGFGGAALAHSLWERSTAASIAVGVLASAMLGGMAFLALGGFAYVAWGAIGQAHREASRPGDRAREPRARTARCEPPRHNRPR